MAVFIEKAHAKINLALHITGQRADGYHTLDTLVTFADAHDNLTLETDVDRLLSLSITGPKAGAISNSDDNLVLRAAGLFFRETGFEPEGHRFTLEKHLPVMAGVGGGSADAATALRLLNQAHETPFSMAELAGLSVQLGADVPMCVHQKSLRAKGIGEEIEFVDIPNLKIGLLDSFIPVSTLDVFAALTFKDNPPLPPLPQSADAKSWMDWLSAKTRNDLMPPAFGLHPKLERFYIEIRDNNLEAFIRMSGSGGCFFSLSLA